MNHLKNWFTRKLNNKTEDESSSRKSFFKLAPCTFIISLIFGIPLSSPRQIRHFILFAVTLLLRTWLTYGELSGMKITSELSIRLVYYSLSYTTFFLFLKKSSSIADFISLGPHSVAKVHKIDVLSLLFYSLVLLFLSFPMSDELSEKDFVPSFVTFSPTFRHILFTFNLAYHIIWVEMGPFCAVVYALGYHVLFEYKWSVLTSIHHLHPVDYSQFLVKLNSVSDKQKRFESIFSCLLFVSLFYNFLATAFFFHNFRVLISQGLTSYYYYTFYCLFLQIVSIGLVFFVSHYNERIKAFSSSVSTQLELQLGKNLPNNSSLIIFLRQKIHESINEPLTACKMVTVDRQIILATAASCVSFAVLLIQINNGALVAST